MDMKIAVNAKKTKKPQHNAVAFLRPIKLKYSKGVQIIAYYGCVGADAGLEPATSRL